MRIPKLLQPSPATVTSSEPTLRVSAIPETSLRVVSACSCRPRYRRCARGHFVASARKPRTTRENPWSIVRERRGHVEILRIDRPEAKNATNPAVAHGIEEALDDVETDPAVRVVVLTGTGDVFSAGADLKMVAAGDSRGFTTKRGGFG